MRSETVDRDRLMRGQSPRVSVVVAHVLVPNL